MDPLSWLLSISADTVGGALLVAILTGGGVAAWRRVEKRLRAREEPPKLADRSGDEPDPRLKDRADAMRRAVDELQVIVQSGGLRMEAILAGERAVAAINAVAEIAPAEQVPGLSTLSMELRAFIDQMRAREVMRIAPVVAKSEELLARATREVVEAGGEQVRTQVECVRAIVKVLRAQLDVAVRRRTMPY